MAGGAKRKPPRLPLSMKIVHRSHSVLLEGLQRLVPPPRTGTTQGGAPCAIFVNTPTRSEREAAGSRRMTVGYYRLTPVALPVSAALPAVVSPGSTAGVQRRSWRSWRRLFSSTPVREEHRTGFLSVGKASSTSARSYLRAASTMWPCHKQGLCLSLAQGNVLVRCVNDVLRTAPGEQGVLARRLHVRGRGVNPTETEGLPTLVRIPGVQ